MSNKNSTRQAIKAIGAVFALLTIAGCSPDSLTTEDANGDSNDAVADGSSNGDTTSLTLGMAVKDDVSGLPLVYATEAGLWEDYGLDVELAYFQGGGALVQGVTGGNVDLGWVAHTPVISAVEKGADLKVVTEVGQSGVGWGIIVEADSPIETVEDLFPGVKISHTSTGSLSHWLALYNGTKAGLDPDEVEDVPIGTSLPTISTALKQQEVDAAAVLLPWGDTLVHSGEARWLTEMVDQLPDFSFAGVIAGETLASDEQTIGCFNGAYSEAVEWLLDNPEDAQEFIQENYNIEEEIIPEVYEQLVPDFNPTGVLNNDRLQVTIEELKAVPGFIEGDVEAEDIAMSSEPLTSEECVS